MLRDPSLLAYLEDLRNKPWTGRVFRTAWVSVGPTVGSGGSSGRWNSPTGDFEVLNTSLEKIGAEREFEAFWSLFVQRPDKKAMTYELEVDLQKMVHLNFPRLEKLGVPQSTYSERSYAQTQKIADAVNYLGLTALKSPSAMHTCDNITIFMQNLNQGFRIEVVEEYEFQWSD